MLNQESLFLKAYMIENSTKNIINWWWHLG
ncbi:hypothetical protein X929_00290 [Petrotoga olearia DSM 13574]|uniref:Uncharacterized protein n=1 Tax=Petrotoga olearia DSM 13574 TaxID=1122955 RepID=A0A2K1P730_9BACT|nr:hypothetical protein X929_00290 [Petrotoga olearia DSM 13574]